jgi:hypothetical protein
MNLDTTSVALDHPSVQLPLIHMNGNDGTKLGREYFDAIIVLGKFEDEFSNIEFHQRDYYPLGDQSWNLARTQREEIKKKIADIREYLEIHAAHCFEAVRK